MTQVGLAYWINDDGGFTGSGLKLYTNGYKLKEVKLLIEALDKNFSIKATMNKTSIKIQYTIYISKKQLPLIINLVKDYIHPTMCINLMIICKNFY